MWSFFADLFRDAEATRTVVVMDAEEVGTQRRYQLAPRRMMAVWAGSLFLVGALVGAMFFFTPMRTLVPGYGTEEIRNRAQLNVMRVRALEDSLKAQRRYIDRLRHLITGGVDTMRGSGPALQSSAPAQTAPAEQEPAVGPSTEDPQRVRGSRRSADHPRPALSPTSFAGSGVPRPTNGSPVSGLAFPVDPPVTSGFPTRGFDAQTGHYGVDVAVSEGTYVRAIGRGYVVVADWTRDGGYTVAVQHPGGYLSVYKHNKRLLKQLGDRVTAREPLAVSGNTGEMTTGPHLHFELWRNGLAQNPHSYIAGW